jgi:hypothetical protein
MLLSYEPSSPYYGREGYHGSLTPTQQALLEEVQRFVLDEAIDLSDLALNALFPQLTLLRYLRANKFDVEKTTTQIQKNVAWRREHKVKELIGKTPEEILGCHMDALIAVFPHWQCGFDVDGRPVMYKEYSKKFQVEKLLKITTLDAIKMYHIWENEACSRLCYEQSLKTGYIVDTVSAVIDIHSLGIMQVTRDFLAIVKSIAEIDQEQYPETLGKTYIINTPSAFPFVWRGIKPWIDPITASKINIFGASEFDEALKSDIGVHSLPLTYGGTRPPLSPEVHPYSGIVFANPDDYSGDHITILDRMKQRYAPLPDRSDAHSERSQESNGMIFPPVDNPNDSIYAPSQASSSSISSSKFSDTHDVYRGMSLHAAGLHQNWDEELHFYNGVLDAAAPRSQRETSTSCEDRLIPSRLLKLPLAYVRKLNLYVVAFGLFMSLSCVGVSSYALSAMYWTSGEVVQLQMWSGVVILCFSCFLSIMNFIGLVGTYTSNSPLLRLYTLCLNFFFLVFIVVGLMSLIIGYGENYISSDRIDRITGEHEDAKKTLQEYNQIVGWVGTCLAFMSLTTFIISLTLIKMFNDAMNQEVCSKVRNIKINQHRCVLLNAQSVLFVVAIAMIGYAGATLNFLFRINFQYPMFAVYALLYSGITVILGGAFGVWASYSSFHSIQRIYHCVVVPAVSFAVVGTAVASALQMTQISKEMKDSYDDLNVNHSKYSIEDLETVIQIELLVGAVLGISTFLYQAVCAVSSVKLHNLLVERSEDTSLDLEAGEGGIYSFPTESDAELRRGKINLCFADKMIIAFSLMTSFLHIYVSGTFVLFATNTSSSSWMLAIWRAMGKYDSRYTSSDAFLVSSSGFMAFVVGPLLLVYIWTIVNKHPVRQVCGIITFSLEIYTYILYFAIAIHTRNTISMDNPTLFILAFLCLNLFRCLVPVWIVIREVRTVIEKTNGSQYRKLKSEAEESEHDEGGGAQRGDSSSGRETVGYSHSHSHSTSGVLTSSSFGDALSTNKEIFVQCDAMDISVPSSSSSKAHFSNSSKDKSSTGGGGLSLMNLRSRGSNRVVQANSAKMV